MLHTRIAPHFGPARFRSWHTEALLIARSLRDTVYNWTGRLLPANPEDSPRRQNAQYSALCPGRSRHTSHQRGLLRQLRIQHSSRQCCHRLARALFQMDRVDLPCSHAHSHSQWNMRTRRQRVARLRLRSKYHLHSCGNPLRTLQLSNHLQPALSIPYMMLQKAPRQRRRCTASSVLLRTFPECNRLHISQWCIH